MLAERVTDAQLSDTLNAVGEITQSPRASGRSVGSRFARLVAGAPRHRFHRLVERP
jgi:hypothetical protein